jgi:hypothetical protein
MCSADQGFSALGHFYFALTGFSALGSGVILTIQSLQTTRHSREGGNPVRKALSSEGLRSKAQVAQGGLRPQSRFKIQNSRRSRAEKVC